MNRFLVAIALVSLALLIQIFAVEAVGVRVNVVFGSLIAAAFFLHSLEVLALAAIVVFSLSAGLVPDGAILFVALAPLIVLRARKVISFERWLASGALAVLGVFASYAVFGPGLFFSHISWVLVDMLIVGAYAALAAFVLEGPKTTAETV